MSERGARRGVGAPFYAPLRRKTSAEIISEARAAIYGEMSSTSSGSGAGGGLRPLRTRRPYTPREPQRSLYTERTRRKEPRPPSAFDLKFLSLSESGEETLAAMDARIAHLDEDTLNDMLAETHNRKKPAIRKETRPAAVAAAGDVWGGFTKLPHLSGRSKPLHRRNTTGNTPIDDIKLDAALARAISVTRPLGDTDSNRGSSPVLTNGFISKSLSSEAAAKRKQFAGNKAATYDVASGSGGGFSNSDIDVKHLAVQLPPTTSDNYDTMTVLELSEALSQRCRDVNRTLQLLEAVIRAVHAATPGGSLRELLLEALYMYTDSDDERVLVAVARAMLTMRVTGPNLTAACKLVFKIAKNDRNDHFFRETNLLELLVEGCGRVEPVSEGECCVFGGAALRVLALSPELAARAHRAGAAHLAALHLKILNNAKLESPRSLGEQSTHALFQVTGALRSLAGAVDQFEHEFLASGALPELVNALALHTDRDVLTNVARCLSVLSGSESCCAWLCGSAAAARALVRALAACAPRAALTVRLAYTLGNMAAADQRAREHIYNEEGAVDVLLTILESYTKKNSQDTPDLETDPDLHLIGTDLGGSDGSHEDVLIKADVWEELLDEWQIRWDSSTKGRHLHQFFPDGKPLRWRGWRGLGWRWTTVLPNSLQDTATLKTVRVVANLCLAERAGRGLADTYAERTIKALLACLELAEKIIHDKDKTLDVHSSAVERGEELATAALATLNNLTFYREPPDPPDPLHVHIDNICKATCRWVRVGGAGGAGAAACEAVRALGNMSRAARTAQLIVLEGALDTLEPFLQHECGSVRCAAAGVLVNVCGAGVARAAAARAAAAALAVAAARRDAAPAPLLARALWNAHAHDHAPLEPAHAHLVAEALAVFIDDESVFAACEASKIGDRCASDSSIAKHHVTFDVDNNNYASECDPSCFAAGPKRINRKLSIEHEDGDVTGEDLGFEDGDVEDCLCVPCRRLAAWDELVGVAIPLMERLRPPRTDASVGTE